MCWCEDKQGGEGRSVHREGSFKKEKLDHQPNFLLNEEMLEEAPFGFQSYDGNHARGTPAKHSFKTVEDYSLKF